MDLLEKKLLSDLQLLKKQLKQFEHTLLSKNPESARFWFFVEKEASSELFTRKTVDFFRRQAAERFPELYYSSIIFLTDTNRHAVLRSLLFALISVVPNASLVFFTSDRQSLGLPSWFNTHTNSFKASNLKVYFFPPLTETLSENRQKRLLVQIIAGKS